MDVPLKKSRNSMYKLKVAIFDKNMAVGKSENLVMLHPFNIYIHRNRKKLGIAILLHATVRTNVIVSCILGANTKSDDIFVVDRSRHHVEPSRCIDG